MKVLIFSTILAVAAAQANAESKFSIGGAGVNLEPSYVTLTENSTEDGYTVTFENNTSGGDIEFYTLYLELNGVSVTVSVNTSLEKSCGARPCPDTATVISLPDGYIAEPKSVTVEELSSGIIRIIPVANIPMG